jgi:hypothetical protein
LTLTLRQPFMLAVMSIPPTTDQVEQPAIRAIARAAGEATGNEGIPR